VANVIRGVAVKVAENLPYQPKLDPAQIADFLGPQKYFSEVAERTEVPGRGHRPGLDATGGDILFIEASQMPGKGNLILNRPPGRRDEGIGARGPVVGAHPCRGISTSIRISRSWTCTCTCQPGQYQRTALRRAWL